MELAGRKVLVLGLGVSGRSAARFCAERGAHVVAADERPPAKIQDLDTLPEAVARVVGEPFPDPADFDLVVPSPGVPSERWASRAARAWGDVELCFRALKVPLIAVTGTNGKSTVVRLIEAMARSAGLRARAAGNLGIPALDLVGEPLDLAILEVSSFQLESVDAFRPRGSVLLNVSADHLDRHGDLESYARAKARIFSRQSAGDHAVLNADDERVRKMALPPEVERLEFSRLGPVERGAWLDGRNAVVRRDGRQWVLPLEGSRLPGRHDDDNVLAALLALAPLEIDLAAATRALLSFEGLPHRCERVAEHAGVVYVDDSKATNAGAAVRALEGFDAPIVWIAGGRHKGGDLSALAPAAAKRVRHALLIGEAAPLLAQALADSVECERADDLDHAVERAATLARAGDVVLLAPACASFDQFESFEDRGRRFRAAVEGLAGGGRS